MFEQIAPVHHLKRGHAVTGEPGLQQSPDRLPRMQGVEIGRLGTYRSVRFRVSALRLDGLCQSFRKNGVAHKLPSVFVEGLSAHANCGRLFLG